MHTALQGGLVLWYLRIPFIGVEVLLLLLAVSFF